MNFQEYLSHFKQVIDKEVEGWFYPKDIIITYGILKELQRPKGDVCEIGVAYGKSAIMISQFKDESNFYLYDIFNEENFEFIKNNVKKIAGEWHLGGPILNEKFRKFRDTYLQYFVNFEVYSIDGVNIKWNLMTDNFLNHYTEIIIYIYNV